jgi:hypothetical protein
MRAGVTLSMKYGRRERCPSGADRGREVLATAVERSLASRTDAGVSLHWATPSYVSRIEGDPQKLLMWARIDGFSDF